MADEPEDAVELWAKRTGRVLAFGVALWLAYSIGQYLNFWK